MRLQTTRSFYKMVTKLEKMKKEMDRLWKLAKHECKYVDIDKGDRTFSRYYKLRGEYVKLKRQKETSKERKR